MSQNKLIASEVNNVITSIGNLNNLSVTAVENDIYGGLVLKISTNWQNKQLRYFMHYARPPGSAPDDVEDPDYIIPGLEDDLAILPVGTTKLVLSTPENSAVGVYDSLLSDDNSGYPFKKAQIFF